MILRGTAPRGVLGNAGTVGFFRGVAILLSAGSAVLLARWLGPSGQGLVAAATAGPTIAALLVALGFGVSNVFYVARGEVGVETALGTSIGGSLGIGLLAGLAYVGVAMIFRESVLDGLPAIAIAIGGVMVPGLLLLRYVSSIAQGLRRMTLFNSVGVVYGLSLLSMNGLFLVVFHLGPVAALCVAVAATFIASLPTLAILVKDYGHPRIDWKYATRAIRFGAKGEAANVIAFVGYRADVLMITSILGFASAGQYVVAFTGAELLWVLADSFAVALFPHVAAATVEGESRATDQTSQVVRITAALLVMFGLAGAAAAPVILPLLFSQQYRAAVLPLELLVPGVILLGVVKVISADLAGRGRPGVASAASAVGLAVMLALDLVLIPRFKVAGASMASSIAYAIVFVLVLRVFRQETGVKVRTLVLLRREDLRVLGATVRERARALGSARRRAGSAGVGP